MRSYPVFLLLQLFILQLSCSAQDKLKNGINGHGFGEADGMDMIYKTQSFTNSMDVLIHQFEHGKTDIALAGLLSLFRHDFFKTTSTRPGFESLAAITEDPSGYIKQFGTGAIVTLLMKFNTYFSQVISHACLTYTAYHLVNGGNILWNIWQIHSDIEGHKTEMVQMETKIKSFIEDVKMYVLKVDKFQSMYSDINKPVSFEYNQASDERDSTRKMLADEGEKLRERYSVLSAEIGNLTSRISGTKQSNSDQSGSTVAASSLAGLAAIGVAGYAGYIPFLTNPIGQVFLGASIVVNVVAYCWSSSASENAEKTLDSMLLDLKRMKGELDIAAKFLREANARIDLGFRHEYRYEL